MFKRAVLGGPGQVLIKGLRLFISKYITCVPLMYFTTIQRAIYFFLPDFVLHLFTLRCSPINVFFSLILDFIKLCTHDFSRVTFATELSTYLVYKVFLS